MSIAAYPITTKEMQWQTSDSFSYTITETKGLSFLYIGKKNEAPAVFESIFHAGFYAENMLQAETRLTGFTLHSIPDVILINIQLNKAEHQRFCSFLKERNFFSRSVIIYNEKKLDLPRIQFLKEKGLVDDIIDLDSPMVNYASKISFLQKVKEQPREESKRIRIGQSPARSVLFFFKRLFDIVVLSVLILLASPFLILIPILIRLESKGAVIYNSRRAGKGFRIFNFYKFRTMVVDADKKIDSLSHLNQYSESGTGAKFLKISNDPRVTRIGKVLRNTSLDELPQLFNVLKGDMSLVGNRPLPLYEASTLTTNDFVERFMAHAGITGLWQVKKRGKSDMSVEERINLDISYARKSSMFFDLWIIAQTPTALFQKTNV